MSVRKGCNTGILPRVVVTSDNSLPRYPGMGHTAEVLVAPIEGTADFFAACPDNLKATTVNIVNSLVESNLVDSLDCVRLL